MYIFFSLCRLFLYIFILFFLVFVVWLFLFVVLGFVFYIVGRRVDIGGLFFLVLIGFVEVCY